MQMMGEHDQRSDQIIRLGDNHRNDDGTVMIRRKPTVRIIRVVEPKVVKTDAANFRSVVQSLTGCNNASLSSRPSDHDRPRAGTCRDRSRPASLELVDCVQVDLRSGGIATQEHVDLPRPGVLFTDGRRRRRVAPAASRQAAHGRAPTPDPIRRRTCLDSYPFLMGGKPHADDSHEGVSSVVTYSSPASSADCRGSPAASSADRGCGSPPLMAAVDDDSWTPYGRAVVQYDNHQDSCTISPYLGCLMSDHGTENLSRSKVSPKPEHVKIRHTANSPSSTSSSCKGGASPVSFNDDHHHHDDDCHDSRHHHRCCHGRRHHQPLLQLEQQQLKPRVRSDPLTPLCTADQHGPSPFYQAFETIFHDQLADTSFDLLSLLCFQDLTSSLPVLEI